MINATIRGLERSSPEPLYQQLASTLEELITTGVLKAGDRLDSEDDLGARFAVSRITIRQAVQALVEKKLLVRKQGKGTFVTSPPVRHDLATGLLASLLSHGPDVRAELLNFRMSQAPRTICDQFGTPVGQPLTELDRLYYVQERAVAYVHGWLVPEVFSIDRAQAQSLSTDEIMRSMGIEIAEVHSSIRAELCPKEIAKLLGTRRHDAILTLHRKRFDAEHSLKEHATAYFRADSYEFFVSSKGRHSDPELNLRRLPTEEAT